MTEPERKDDVPVTFTDWLGLTDAPRWWVARPLGIAVSVVMLLLFVLALSAAVVVLARSFAAAEAGLGTGGLIVALLGAPFLIWSTVLKHQTLRYQKEGHITDRINKAVEQLGAEKTVERIGRPVTIFTGEPETVEYDSTSAEAFEGRPRTKISKRSWEQSYNQETDIVESGYRQDVSTWPEERTDIQWQNEKIELSRFEAIGIEDKWQVFKETKPNIEVRIGAILSLERIAQDSTKYDKGRDHVRVMEILCAYIRENAPRRKGDVGSEKPPQRIDIQKGLDVIKRRGMAVRDIETQERYRLDLRETDLRGYDLSRGNFVGAIFWGSNLESANFWLSDLTATQFNSSRMTGSILIGSTLHGTNFNGVNFEQNALGGMISANLVSVFIEDAEMPNFYINPEKGWRVFGSNGTKVSESMSEIIRAGRILAESRFYTEMGIRSEKDYSELVGIHQSIAKEEAEKFAHWNIYSANDWASDTFRQKFKVRHNLIGWPFED